MRQHSFPSSLCTGLHYVKVLGIRIKLRIIVEKITHQFHDHVNHAKNIFPLDSMHDLGRRVKIDIFKAANSDMQTLVQKQKHFSILHNIIQMSYCAKKLEVSIYNGHDCQNQFFGGFPLI